MAGGSGASSRGRGGKFKKYTRGGGHHFSRNLQPLDKDGNAVSMWSAEAQNNDDDDSDDSEEDSDEEEDSEEEDSDEEAEKKPSAAEADASREDRRAQKKARKEAAIAKQKAKNVEVGDLPSSEEESEDEDEDMPANPNHSKAARKQATAPGGVDGITEGVKKMGVPTTRREREAAEAAAAKEKYMKLHAAGKTDEAKADLARLKVIREQRAAEAARKQAEKDEKDEKDKERRAEVEAREAKRREAAAGPKKGSKKK